MEVMNNRAILLANASTYSRMNQFMKISAWLLLNQACMDITGAGVRDMNAKLHDALLRELTKSM